MLVICSNGGHMHVTVMCSCYVQWGTHACDSHVHVLCSNGGHMHVTFL